MFYAAILSLLCVIVYGILLCRVIFYRYVEGWDIMYIGFHDFLWIITL